MPELAAALETLLAGLPARRPGAPVRLWIDRAFTIRGAGTVVTGTLAAGTVAAGDRLLLGDREVVVRGVQSLGRAGRARRPRRPGWRSTCAGSPSRSSPAATRC